MVLEEQRLGRAGNRRPLQRGRPQRSARVCGRRVRRQADHLHGRAQLVCQPQHPVHAGLPARHHQQASKSARFPRHRREIRRGGGAHADSVLTGTCLQACWHRAPAIPAPLGRAVVGGLSGRTIATLIILPAIFAILQSRKTRESISLHPADRGEQAPELAQPTPARVQLTTVNE